MADNKKDVTGSLHKWRFFRSGGLDQVRLEFGNKRRSTVRGCGGVEFAATVSRVDGESIAEPFF